jgi:colanic acid/amylovoran biosynthesis glycosyltransferase
MDARLQSPKLQSEMLAITSGVTSCSGCLHEPSASTQKTMNAAPPWRLVYLLSCYPGISHTFFLNEIRELRKRGFIIDVVSINSSDRPRSLMPANEIEESENTFYIKSSGVARAVAIAAKTLILRPAVMVSGLAAVLRLGRGNPSATLLAFFYFVEALILGDWMRVRGLRHLHIHFCGPVATVGMMASIAWGFSYSLTVHGPDEFYDVEKFYLKEKIEHARLVLCISDFCRSQLMRLVSPQHWDKMHVVPLGIDPKVFFPVPHEPRSKDPLEILCVGRLVPSKGQRILLQACNLLLSKGYSLRVRLVGAGPDSEHLQSYAQEKGITAIFEGAKSHEETKRLLERADIFALASFAEGVPVALMEAMAMEIPCVSTRIAGIPELIRDGLDGLLVPASSDVELASALERLIVDPSQRRSLGVAGCKRVLDLYNLSQNVDKLARVFREQVPNSI